MKTNDWMMGLLAAALMAPVAARADHGQRLEHRGEHKEKQGERREDRGQHEEKRGERTEKRGEAIENAKAPPATTNAGSGTTATVSTPSAEQH